ncbi:hypothetical protein [Halorubrum coriense]|nr:hypothetical protein [Halorubrum coriense]
MQALLNGRQRLRRMVESGEFSDDLSLPVYHAANLSVTLDVGLEARETKRGIQVFVTEPSAGDQTELGLDLEVYDFLQAGDLTDATDDRRRPGGGLDVHVPLREPPVDSGDAVGSVDVDESSEDIRKEARSGHERTKDERTDDERTDDERTDDERTDDEQGETRSPTDESTKPTTKTDEKRADEGKRSKDDERNTDEDAAEKRTERARERLRKPAKFPGLSLPRGWARDRENRDAREDDR